jgi:hypothetical protein
VRFGVIPSVAVALSLGALLVESLVLPAAVIGPWIVRLIAAAAVAAMLEGFWLFQGVFWPAWWILLLSFAPWHLIAPTGPPKLHAKAEAGHYVRRFSLRHAQAAVLALAVIQQCAASAMRLERPPLVSAYDMYSTSYDSPAQYPPTGGQSYWLIATMADNTTSACRIDDDDGRRLGASAESAFIEDARGLLGSCFRDTQRIRALAVEEHQPRVDWTAGRYLGLTRRPLVGPVAYAGEGGG